MTSSPDGLSHHVEINVSDLDASLAFWGWLLDRWGYQPYQRWEHGASSHRGTTYLVFVSVCDEHRGRPHHRCAPGLDHLAFHAPDTDAVDSLTRELTARGVPILYGDRHPHAGGPDTPPSPSRTPTGPRSSTRRPSELARRPAIRGRIGGDGPGRSE